VEVTERSIRNQPFLAFEVTPSSSHVFYLFLVFTMFNQPDLHSSTPWSLAYVAPPPPPRSMSTALLSLPLLASTKCTMNGSSVLYFASPSSLQLPFTGHGVSLSQMTHPKPSTCSWKHYSDEHVFLVRRSLWEKISVRYTHNSLSLGEGRLALPFDRCEK